MNSINMIFDGIYIFVGILVEGKLITYYTIDCS